MSIAEIIIYTFLTIGLLPTIAMIIMAIIVAIAGSKPE